jgi:hypothetical protein
MGKVLQFGQLYISLCTRPGAVIIVTIMGRAEVQI